MSGNTTFLLSSFKSNPDKLFQGYCFVKEDFVFGELGAELYFKENSHYIPAGEDGCYVVAEKVGSDFIIGADSSGYKKVLYFKDIETGNWAVSNSLNLLVEHLKKNSIKISPNVKAILMMAVPTSFGQQPLTFNTIVNEIKILPVNSLLIIGQNKLEIRKVNEFEAVKRDYNEILINFVNMWASRYATLLNNKNILIEQGLTGGLDSRAIFSLFETASQHINHNINADFRLKTGLTRGSDIDLKIAEIIGKHYGHIINNKSETKYKPIVMSNERRYSVWKDLSLGLYHPIYMPASEPDYRKISIGGQGGENYRAQYKKLRSINNYDDFVKHLCRKINDSDTKIDFALDMERALLEIKRYYKNGDSIDDLTLHYIQFRTRFHAGLFPQYRVSFTPLSSKYLADIVTNENFSKIENFQVLYDLINATDNLLQIPFDYEKKAPKKENLEQLTDIRHYLKVNPGRIYISDVIEEEQKVPWKPIFQYLKDDFDAAKNTNLVQELWSKEYIHQASTTLNLALEEKRLSHATDGIPIAAIIATGLFS